MLQTNTKALDATHAPWHNEYFDYAVSNLPYGKQIPLAYITVLYEKTLGEYIRITKPTGTICFLLTNPQLMEKYVKKYAPQAKVKAWKLGFTGQTPTIMLIQKII